MCVSPVGEVWMVCNLVLSPSVDFFIMVIDLNWNRSVDAVQV